MNYPRILIAIFVMALVTYLIRAIPLVIFRKKIKNVYVQSFLYYVPYAVLGAMTFPDILQSYRRAVGDSRGLCDGAAAVLPGMTCLQIAGTVIK